jgi:hypothetical protein
MTIGPDADVPTSIARPQTATTWSDADGVI